MDSRLFVLIASLGLLGFLFYPRPELSGAPSPGVWVTTVRNVEKEPPRFPLVQRREPVLATYDLGFIYRLDRFDLTFEKPSENGPKLYEVLVSPTREGPYKRVFTFRSASRFYPYTIQNLPEPTEARWIQVAVTDWFSGTPSIKSFQAGPLYRRDWNPIRSVRVSHNASDASRLFDGVTNETSKWAGARLVEATGERGGKRATEKERRSPNSDVWALFDLGTSQRLYGTRVTTDGNGNSPRFYRILLSSDGRTFEPVHTSADLPDETQRIVHLFPEPLVGRFVRLEIPKGAWHGDYPELREVEIFTDTYRLPPSKSEAMSDYNPIAIAYDNGGVDLRRSPHLVTGFVYDRGAEAPEEERFGWRSDEIEGLVTEAQRTFLYHYDALRFEYTGLNPSHIYWIQVTTLQNKGGGRLQNLIADGFLLHGDEVPVPSGNPQPFTAFIPPEAVADGVLRVSLHRLAGPNAVVSEVTLFEARRTLEEVAVTPVVYGYATQVRSAVKLDGHLDEWDLLYPFPATGDLPDVKAFLQWDSENLYVAVSAPRRSSGRSLLDTLDLFVDSRNTKSPTVYRKGDLHLRIFRFGSGKELIRFVKHYSEEAAPRSDAPPVEMASGREGDRYVLELRLPRANLLDGWNPRIGERIGFNYILVTRDGKRAFGASPGTDDPPSRWRTYRLLGSIRGEIAIFPQSPEKTFRGEPRERFNAGDTLWLLLRDPDRNQDPRTIESVTLSVYGGTGGQREILLREVEGERLLIEGLEKAQTTDSEYFAGILPTEFGTEPLSPQEPYPVQGGESLTFLYRDPFYDPAPRDVVAKTTANTGVTGTVVVTDTEDKPLPSFAAGTTLRFRLEDADLTSEIIPSEPNVPRRVLLPVYSETDRVFLEMTEREAGVFLGELTTEYAETPNPDDTTLQVVGAQNVRVIYLDQLQANGRTRVPLELSLRVEIGSSGLVRVRTPGEPFPTEIGRLVSFRAGSGLLVRVEDGDLNHDPSRVETTTALLTGDKRGDRLLVTLRELSANAPFFEGFVKTRFAEAADPENDLLELVGGETVTITYTDALQGSGATNVPVTAKAQTLTGHDGTLAITHADYLKRLTQFNAGDRLHFRVHEKDPEEPLFVEVFSKATGDRERVSLTPSAAAENAFLGSIPTLFGESPVLGDGVLQVVGGEQVRVEYRDALRASGESGVLLAETCQVNAGNDGSLRIALRTEQGHVPLRGEFRAGATLLLEVEDSDLNALSEVIEQVTVSVDEDLLGDRGEVLLRETSGNSGLFRGELKTTYSETAEQNDNLLQCHGGSLVTFRYVDALRANGAVNVTLQERLSLETGTTGEVAFLTPNSSRLLGSFAPGERVQVRVRDADQNQDPSAVERVLVTLLGETNGDTVVLPLVETEESSGEFVGFLQTALVTSPNNVVSDDSVLQIGVRERLSATYVDELTGDGEPHVPVRALAVAAGSTPGALLLVDDRGQEIGSVRAGERIHLLLDDIFLASVADVEEATIQVEGNLIQDRVSVVLRAVAGKIGQYVGTLSTRFGTTPIADNVLDVQGGEEIRARYVSPLTDAFHIEVESRVVVGRGTRGRLAIVRPDDNILRTVSPGASLRFRLEDPDANRNPHVLERLELLVRVENSSFSRSVSLRETEANSGVFRGELATTLGQQTEALPLRGGERIVAVYRDALTETGETNVEITATTRIRKVGFAPFTEEEVLVDGLPDRWPLENVMATSGNVGLAWAQWNRDALYLFVEIADDGVAVKDPTRWYENADAVEFHLNTHPDGDFRPSHLSEGEMPSEYVFWVCPKGAGLYGERPYVGRARPTRQPNFTPIQVAVREEETSYRLEIRLPFQRALPGFDPITSVKLDRLGFNYRVYRSDAPQVWWAPPESPTDPPSAYGVLFLHRPETGVTSSSRRVSPSRAP